MPRDFALDMHQLSESCCANAKFSGDERRPEKTFPNIDSNSCWSDLSLGGNANTHAPASKERIASDLLSRFE